MVENVIIEISENNSIHRQVKRIQKDIYRSRNQQDTTVTKQHSKSQKDFRKWSRLLFSNKFVYFLLTQGKPISREHWPATFWTRNSQWIWWTLMRGIKTTFNRIFQKIVQIVKILRHLIRTLHWQNPESFFQSPIK